MPVGEAKTDATQRNEFLKDLDDNCQLALYKTEQLDDMFELDKPLFQMLSKRKVSISQYKKNKFKNDYKREKFMKSDMTVDLQRRQIDKIKRADEKYPELFCE